MPPISITSARWARPCRESRTNTRVWNIRPEQYPIVGLRHLVGAIVVDKVLGDAVNQETLGAWEVAYGQLADIFIGAEAKLYQGAAWSGFRPFKVARKEVGER